MKFFPKSLLAAAAIVASLGAQATVVIDDFTDPVVGGQTVTDINYTTDTVGVGSSLNSVNVLGGQRDIFVIEVPVTGSPDGSQGVSAIVEDGVYGFSSNNNKAGVGIIRWDGGNTSFAQQAADSVGQNVLNAVGSVDAVGFAAQDLTVGGIAGFRITVLQADAGFPFTLMAYSGANSSAVSDIALETSLGSPNTFFIPFAVFAFGTQVGTGADFTAITALQAVINFPGQAVANVDLTIDLVQRVPEPGALALVGLALAGLGMSRRFGRKTA